MTGATDPRPAQIAAMLAGRPLADYGAEMVAVADRYGIDWRLLPVISFLESGGGVAACGGNAWGYLRCETTFADYSVGMQRVAQTLAAYPYAGESIATIMCIWQSGGGCSTAPAVDYAYLGAPYYARLGEPIGLPPRIAAETVDDPAPAAEAAAGEPVAPVAEPTATPTPGGEAPPTPPSTPAVAPRTSDNEAGAESTPAPAVTPTATG
ncbi:MAG TPA: hypothetical protein VFK32_01665 [Tepidiformaceae bacterium]|nr:hypothetical protein [Tepidiformaceae bacterium]